MYLPSRQRPIAAWILSPALALACIAPAAAQSSFNETFTANTLPDRFEQTGPVSPNNCTNWGGDGPVFDSGKVRFRCLDIRGDSSGFSRTYLRTKESDYAAHDFTAEVTVTNTVTDSRARSIAFFGFGDGGVGQSGGSGTVNFQGFWMEQRGRYFFPGVGAVDFNPGSPVGLAGTGCDASSGWVEGTHRLRIKWTAATKTAVVSAHRNYAGEPFVASCTFPVIDGSNNGYTATNSRLYIGGDWDITFDNFVVVVNRPPTANAGPDQSIRAGATVTLGSSSSSDDNTATELLGRTWSIVAKPAGSAAALNNPSSASPSFVADMPGTYQVNLVVTDAGGLSSAPDSVVISSNNLAPTANAGTGQMVSVFSTVTLNGSGSTDPENDPLTYAWTISSRPAGSTTVLSGPTTATPNFQPDQPGAYTLTLTVSDFLGAGSPASVEVTAITAAAYAEQKIMCGADLIAGLGPNQVTTKGNETALGNFLSQAVKEVQKGNNAKAIFKINEAIERTNGCEVNPGLVADGNGPGRDWVTDCGVQPPILACLRAARDALTP